MLPVYTENCLFLPTFYNCTQKFSSGHSDVVDNVQSGRPVRIRQRTQAEEMVRADSHLTITIAICCLHGLAYSIRHERLQYGKVYLRWVLRQLTEEHKDNRRDLPMEHLFPYVDEREDMINRIVTVN